MGEVLVELLEESDHGHLEHLVRDLQVHPASCTSDVGGYGRQGFRVQDASLAVFPDGLDASAGGGSNLLGSESVWASRGPAATGCGVGGDRCHAKLLALSWYRYP